MARFNLRLHVVHLEAKVPKNEFSQKTQTWHLNLHEFATYYQLTMQVIPPVYMRSSAAIWRRSGQSSGRMVRLAVTCPRIAAIWRELAGSFYFNIFFIFFEAGLRVNTNIHTYAPCS